MSRHKYHTALCWFRRDLRLQDQAALSFALQNANRVLLLFVFDNRILQKFQSNDPRIGFIYDNLFKMNQLLSSNDAGFFVKRGEPKQLIQELSKSYEVDLVVANEDYEPDSIQRDILIRDHLKSIHVDFKVFKDHVVFSKSEITKNDGSPYVVYTPYSKKWLEKFDASLVMPYPINITRGQIIKPDQKFPSFESFGFERNTIKVVDYSLSQSMMNTYEDNRDYPAIQGTSKLGPHLRFGTISIRTCITNALKVNNQTFLKELIWREFFMQILWNYPHVKNHPFKKKYEQIIWRNDEKDFEKWCKGETGYPIVDAGMRELNLTGYMHNRVRMITASFLCKHLLIDWRWGEAYFAQKLLDFDLAQNNGNWQWVAGTGCDAAPYFRIFNPEAQSVKFDKEQKYINKWVPELKSGSYCKPMVEHREARERCLQVYNQALKEVS